MGVRMGVPPVRRGTARSITLTTDKGGNTPHRDRTCRMDKTKSGGTEGAEQPEAEEGAV